MTDSIRDMNSVNNDTLSPKPVGEELAHKVNSSDPIAENHNDLIVECYGDSTVSSKWSIIKTPGVDFIDLFNKFSNDDHPAISQDTFDKLNRTMSATNFMALYTMGLLGYVSFLSGSSVVTLPTPSHANDSTWRW